MRVRVRHRLGAFALDVAFTGPEDGITMLFGPSGAGKSMTLAIVAGLMRADEAEVAVGDHVLTDTARRTAVPAERRRIGIVHQDARLFPHLSVERNLAYGWRRAPQTVGGERRIEWDAVIEVLAIGHLLGRRPLALSGGERQRVAIGRALLSQPELLLLDEPVSALDEARRGEVLNFISALKRFALPMLYVTHREDEVRLLGDHLVRIEAGRVVAEGVPADLLPSGLLMGEVVAPGVMRIGGQTLVVPGLVAPVGAAVRVSW